MSHTPGPWQIDSDPNFQRDIIGEELLATAYVQAKGGEKVAIANARLIAAAPELLEALVKLWKHTPQIDGGRCAVCRCAFRFWDSPGKPGPCENARCLSHVVEAAIGKAQGRS